MFNTGCFVFGELFFDCGSVWVYMPHEIMYFQPNVILTVFEFPTHTVLLLEYEPLHLEGALVVFCYQSTTNGMAHLV